MSFAVVLALMLLLLGAVNVYFSHRIHQCLCHFWPQLSRGYVLAFFILMTLILVFGFARSLLPLPQALRNALGLVSSCWMGIFVYLLLFLLVADVLFLIGGWLFNLSPHRWLGVLAAVVLTLATTAWGTVHANQPKPVAYHVQLPLKQEMKIVLVSDLHLGAVGSERRLERIVDAINAQGPDVVCMAGDLFDNDFYAIHSPDEAARTLQQLQSTYGVYACAGNHDAGSTVPEMLCFLDECGIQLLADETAIIGEQFVLAGRLDGAPIGGFGGRKRGPLESVLADAPEGLPVVVMDHNPASAISYDSSVSLVLCGHTHKGQIFPGSLITHRMYEVDHGQWQKDSDSPHIIVTSGAGTWGLPMRVGTDSEVVTITLYP